MHIQDEKNSRVGSELQDQVKIDNSRRKITKAGVITPVVMSLTSNPLWAGNCTVSGMLSGNLSVNYDEKCPLPGLSIAYWIANPDNICDPNDDSFGSDSNFNDFFSLVQQVFSSGTILGVLNGTAPLNIPPPLCTGSASNRSAYNNAIKLAAAQMMASWLSAVNLAPHYANNTSFDSNGVVTAFETAAGLSASPHACTDNISTLNNFTSDFAAYDNAVWV